MCIYGQETVNECVSLPRVAERCKRALILSVLLDINLDGRAHAANTNFEYRFRRCQVMPLLIISWL